MDLKSEEFAICLRFWFMRKMKDSGIEWIGDIPKDWSITKIKFLLSNENDSLKVGPFGSQLSGTDFVAEGYWVYSQRVVLDKNFEHNSMLVTKEKFDAMSAFRVRENDILITTRGTIGKICRVPKKFSEGILHPCIIKFRIDEQKYCYKLLELIFNHSGILQKQLNYLSNATTIEVIYSGTLKNLQIPFPPLDEQKKIADFLDEKCGEIDSIRSDILNQIDILNDYKKSVITEAVTKGLNPKVKLKDSGIEWIGKIPEHWEIKPIKTIAKIYNGREVEEELDENDFDAIRVFGSGGVFKFTNKSLYEGEAVLFGRKGTIGKPMIVSGAFWTVDTMYYSVCKQGNDNRFLYYILTVFPWEPYTTQTALPSVVATEIFRNSIGVPSFPEQKKITDFLDEKCTEIETAIAEKQKQLETLDKYKKSLIFEYVTGKKEVLA